ncbi:hypothetical protein AB0467_11075 [Streptomyces sp. NPDC052095]|uniref:hypothetical protein n=1 Tax=Streptomyces sp. NPDC052095 TaxID=3155678 RepID=UPI00344D936D
MHIYPTHSGASQSMPSGTLRAIPLRAHDPAYDRFAGTGGSDPVTAVHRMRIDRESV